MARTTYPEPTTIESFVKELPDTTPNYNLNDPDERDLFRLVNEIVDLDPDLAVTLGKEGKKRCFPEGRQDAQ